MTDLPSTPVWSTPHSAGSCPPPTSLLEPTCDQASFPFYPNSGTGYKTPAEWTSYRYDLLGNMVRAENADAVVERTYYPNGQVRTDSTRIRDFSADNTFSRIYGIEYGYNEGRLTRLIHPANLANLDSVADTDKFFYDPRTGAMSAAEDRNHNLFTFNYDHAGRMTSLVMPGGVVDSLRYDLAGRTTWRRETSPQYTVPLQHETFVYDARGKVLAVAVPATLGRDSSTFAQWYSGIGNLVMTDWVNGSNPQWQRERFTIDPLGNTVQRHEYRSGAEGPSNDHPDYRTTYNPFFGRVDKIERIDPQGFGGSTPPVDESWFRYDEAGNQTTTYQRSGEGGGSGFTHLVDTRSFYGADDRLRAFQKYDDVVGSIQSTSSGVWEEYRYDPLGRRVAVRTLRPTALCNQPAECYNSTTYFVWAGDQLLWEIREADATNNEHADGIVSYFQAGGIDRPLTIWKSGIGTVVTHQSWRGQFARGTFGNGPRAGESSDCTEYPATNGCIPVRWPGWNTTAWSQEAAKPATTGAEEFWFGSLSVGMRDASGQQYMRNRYYNPQTGQFTQPDPIGLAGGLNSYGFAAGDPVSYDDPYGLSVDTVYVGRRHLDGALGSLGDHAAVRVKVGGSDQVGELLNIEDENYIAVWDGAQGGRYPNGAVHTASDYEWTVVETPNGMTDEEFSAAVIRTFNEVAAERRHKDYSFAGSRNSNNFVWSVIRRAGGSMPNIHELGRVMPGICGGVPRAPFQPGFQCQ